MKPLIEERYSRQLDKHAYFLPLRGCGAITSASETITVIWTLERLRLLGRMLAAYPYRQL